MSADTAPIAVLDASALIALVYQEPGFQKVRNVIARGTIISAVNWAEVLSDMAERGEPSQSAAAQVTRLVAAVGSLTIVPFEHEQAAEAARLRPITKSLALSLADRACLGLARLRRLPAYTTDRLWRSANLPVRIELIR